MDAVQIINDRMFLFRKYRATEKLKLDEAQPTTSIQIRLADGSRLSGRFNMSHTINDIRTYISK